MEPFQQMVQGYASQDNAGRCRGTSGRGGYPRKGFRGTHIGECRQGVEECGKGTGQGHGGYTHDQRNADPAEGTKPRAPQKARGESGGVMLNVNGLQRFWYVRNFHDMRCKYDRVLSIIREQFHREPQKDEVFIIMSKDRRKARLFNYDRRSATLFEKRFNNDYRFMKVEHIGEETFYSIDWKDVALLLASAVMNKLTIK